jgi:NAD(P)-dependent dehydrogenase (short-subunit alcohol dehydrogenase family)
MSTKVALVTAGAQGLGGHLVAHLLASGYRVIAHWRTRRGGLEQLSEAYGDALVTVQADLSVAEGREALYRAAALQGRLDLLVNNIGVYPEQTIEAIDLDLWNSTLELTLTANFHLTQLCTELLAGQDRARVVNIGDSGADRIEARTQATPYHIAKMGVHILTRTYAQVLTARGTTVNMISPGFLVNSVGEPNEAIPAGRVGAFEDICGAMDYLLSEAADYVSGTNILVNGGWNLG